MLERLKQILKELDEAIRYSEDLDHAYTSYYLSLIRKRKAIVRAIKAFEKEDRRLKKHGEV
jgi:hypothetical protein